MLNVCQIFSNSPQNNAPKPDKKPPPTWNSKMYNGGWPIQFKTDVNAIIWDFSTDMWVVSEPMTITTWQRLLNASQPPKKKKRNTIESGKSKINLHKIYVKFMLNLC